MARFHRVVYIMRDLCLVWDRAMAHVAKLVGWLVN